MVIFERLPSPYWLRLRRAEDLRPPGWRPEPRQLGRLLKGCHLLGEQGRGGPPLWPAPHISFPMRSKPPTCRRSRSGGWGRQWAAAAAASAGPRPTCTGKARQAGRPGAGVPSIVSSDSEETYEPLRHFILWPVQVQSGHRTPGQGERCTVLSRPDSRFLVAGMFTEPTSWKAGSRASLSPQHPPAAWTARCPLEKVTMCRRGARACP